MTLVDWQNSFRHQFLRLSQTQARSRQELHRKEGGRSSWLDLPPVAWASVWSIGILIRVVPPASGGGPVNVEEESSSVWRKQTSASSLHMSVVRCSSGSSAWVVSAICRIDSSWDRLAASDWPWSGGVGVLVLLDSGSCVVGKSSESFGTPSSSLARSFTFDCATSISIRWTISPALAVTFTLLSVLNGESAKFRTWLVEILIGGNGGGEATGAPFVLEVVVGTTVCSDRAGVFSSTLVGFWCSSAFWFSKQKEMKFGA